MKNLVKLDGSVKKRRGFKLIKEFDDSEPIVSMTTFNNIVYIATSKSVYQVINDQLIPLEIYKK